MWWIPLGIVLRGMSSSLHPSCFSPSKAERPSKKHLWHFSKMEEPWDFNLETNELNFNVLFQSESFALEKGRLQTLLHILFLFLHLHFSVGNENKKAKINLNLHLQPCHHVSANWDSQEVQAGSAAVRKHWFTAPNDVSQTAEIQKALSFLCMMQTGIEGINLTCR